MQNASGGLKLGKCLAESQLIAQINLSIIIANIYWMRFFFYLISRIIKVTLDLDYFGCLQTYVNLILLYFYA